MHESMHQASSCIYLAMDRVFGYIKELIILLIMIMLKLSRIMSLSFRDVYLGMKCHDVCTLKHINNKNSNKKT